MRLSILDFTDDNITLWIVCRIAGFSFWVATEKWWSHGHEHVIGVRFGNRYFEKRFNRE
jgi:hypothetical protein